MTPRTADVGSYEAPLPIFKEVNYYEMSVSFTVELNHRIQISLTSVKHFQVTFVLLKRRRGYSRVISRKKPDSEKSSNAEGSLQKMWRVLMERSFNILDNKLNKTLLEVNILQLRSL